jgi:hypothetical protein
MLITRLPSPIRDLIYVELPPFWMDIRRVVSSASVSAVWFEKVTESMAKGIGAIPGVTGVQPN